MNENTHIHTTKKRTMDTKHAVERQRVKSSSITRGIREASKKSVNIPPEA